MGINVTVDEKLIEEARKLTGLKTDAEVVEGVLRRYVAGRYKHKDILDLAGKIEFRDGFDPRDLRS